MVKFKTKSCWTIVATLLEDQLDFNNVNQIFIYYDTLIKIYKTALKQYWNFNNLQFSCF